MKMIRFIRAAFKVIDAMGDVDLSGGQNKLRQAAQMAYSNSLDMAGTEGQLSVLKELTVDDYYEVAEGLVDGSASPEDLLGMVSHPEAVEEILTEAGSILEDAAEEQKAMSAIEE